MSEESIPQNTGAPNSNIYPSKPANVGYAVITLYIAQAFAVIIEIINASRLPDYAELMGLNTAGGIILMIGLNALSIFFIYMMGTGRNWARIILFIGFFGFVPRYLIMTLTEILPNDPTGGALDLVWMTLQTVGILGFLIIGSTNTWFKEMKATRKAIAQGNGE